MEKLEFVAAGGISPFRTDPDLVFVVGVVRQANLLLEQLNAGSIIGCVEDITAPIFVTLFEGLCGEKLSGIYHVFKSACNCIIYIRKFKYIK